MIEIVRKYNENNFFPSDEAFRKAIRRAIEIKLPKVEWDREKVMALIEGCKEQFGEPVFITGYGGEDFKYDNKPAVVFECRGGKGPEMSALLTNVPEDKFIEMKNRTGDWRFLAMEFDPEKYEKLAKLPVIF